jgi:hypothetical protein
LVFKKNANFFAENCDHSIKMEKLGIALWLKTLPFYVKMEHNNQTKNARQLKTVMWQRALTCKVELPFCFSSIQRWMHAWCTHLVVPRHLGKIFQHVATQTFYRVLP